MTLIPPFLWAVGEESSDPWVSRNQQPHRIDQLSLSQHLQHQQQDLRAIADLGVQHVRYGMPWRLSEPAQGQYDWSLWDQALQACAAEQLTPIVDLLHFGLPDWAGTLSDISWVRHFRQYVSAFVARYPQIRLYTPVNEPAWTAITSGYLGLWNDQKASPADYLTILSHMTLANLEALEVIRAAHPDNLWISAETFNIPILRDPANQAAADKQRAMGWLVWDWHLGLTPPDTIRAEVEAVVAPDTLARIQALAVNDRLLAGHDFYPSGIQCLDGDDSDVHALTVSDRLALYEQEARAWYARYQVPFWISETSNFTLPPEQQQAWLDGFYAVIARLRADQIPLNGFCWYSRGDQFDWQTLLAEPTGQVTPVGLIDAQRQPRPAAKAFTQRALAGAPCL